MTVEPETGAEPESETAIWDALSPELQERVAASVEGAVPLVDPEWWRIVRRTCAVNAFANCVCCAPTAQACNPTNWQCCASAVFQPADGSSCSTPDPCRCVPPSAASPFDDEPAAATVCRAE